MDPVIGRLEKLLHHPPDFPLTTEEETPIEPWLAWLHKSLDCLTHSEVFDQLPFMVESGLQGRCSQFRWVFIIF